MTEKLYRCCVEDCPGYPYRASEVPHPCRERWTSSGSPLPKGPDSQENRATGAPADPDDRIQRVLMLAEAWLHDIRSPGLPFGVLKTVPEVRGWHDAQQRIWERRLETLREILGAAIPEVEE